MEPLEDADLVAIIDHITEVYSSIEGWELTRKQATAGYPKLLLDHPQFGNYIVSGWRDQNVINVFSFSPCFHLPDDMSSRGGY